VAKSLSVRVITPTETILEIKDAAWVQVQLVDGSLGIWPGHAPLLAETISAQLRYAAGTHEHALDVEAGILQIDREGVTIFTGGLIRGEAHQPAAPENRIDRLSRAHLAMLGAYVEGIPDEDGRETE